MKNSDVINQSTSILKDQVLENVPELRFPEFEGEWVELNLKDLTKINQGLQIPISERYLKKVEDSHFYITNEFLKQESKNKYYIKSPPSSVLCNEDDILMTRTGNTGQVVTGVSGAFHNNFFKIKYDKKITSKGFLFYFLTSYKIQCLILRLAGTSTIPDLNHGDFYKIKILSPTLPEQQKIANFLTAVDTKIQQLTKKKELLEQYKKGVMQQIFSQEIRFKDENGNDYSEWEEKRIKDFAPLQRGFDLPLNEIVEGKYPVVFSNGILKSHCTFKAKAPGVVTGRSGTIGKVTYVENDYWPHNTSLWVTDFNGNDPKFVFYFYLNFKLERFGTGSGVPTLNRNDVHIVKEFIPILEEQQKISDFLTDIDKKVEIVCKQIEQKKFFKKALLQQMFV